MPTAYYFLGDRLLGSRPNVNKFASSIAYACTTCGEVWGRIVIQSPPSTYLFVIRPCAEHTPTGVPDWGEMHRSGLFQWWTPDEEQTSVMFQHAVPSSFPRSVLTREFLLMYEHYRRDYDLRASREAGQPGS